MKTISALIIFCFLVTACSSSYVVSSSGEDTSVDEFNKLAEGEEAEIILTDNMVHYCNRCLLICRFSPLV